MASQIATLSKRLASGWRAKGWPMISMIKKLGAEADKLKAWCAALGWEQVLNRADVVKMPHQSSATGIQTIPTTGAAQDNK